MFENISQLALACTHGAHKCKPIYVDYMETSILKFCAHRPNTLEIFSHRTALGYCCFFLHLVMVVVLYSLSDGEASEVKKKCQN